MCQRPLRLSAATPSWRTLIASKGDEHSHLDHRDRGRPPADLLRHHQRVGVPRRGPARQALDLDRGLPDRRQRGQPAARPGARRRDRRVRPQGAADRLRRAVAHVLAAAPAARPRGGRRRAHLHARRPSPPTWSGIEWFKRRRPRPGARHHAGVLPVPARGAVRPLPDDDRRARRGRLHRDRAGSTASTRTRSAPARCTCGSTVPRAASRARDARRPTPTTSARPPGPTCPPPADPPRRHHDPARDPPHPARRQRRRRRTPTARRWWPATAARWRSPTRSTCRR